VKSLCRSLALVLHLIAVPSLVTRASAQTDTIFTTRPLFTWRDGVLAGAFIVATISIRPVDKSAALALQYPARQKNQVLQRMATVVRNIALPGSTIIGPSMYAIGRLTKEPRLAQLGLHGTEALLLGAGIGSVLKDAFGRARPFVDTVSPNPDDFQLLRGFRAGDNYRSFPSGHTLAAFAAAAAVSAETSRWWKPAPYTIGPLMYGGAAAVGISRMYNNRHWASDVIMGAAIGTFAGTKVVRYHLTHPGNRIDRWLINASFNPSDPGRLSLSVLPVLGRSSAHR
jgi:membrane-associated phospholipid phosphatase